jgi:hypothetical protein
MSSYASYCQRQYGGSSGRCDGCGLFVTILFYFISLGNSQQHLRERRSCASDGERELVSICNQRGSAHFRFRSLPGRSLLAGYGIWGPGFGVNWLVGPAFGESVSEGVVTDRWGAKAVIEMNATNGSNDGSRVGAKNRMTSAMR